MPRRSIRPALRRSAVAAAAAAAGILSSGLPATGATRGPSLRAGTLKTSQIERLIVDQFAAQGVRLHRVSCASGVQAAVGARISCTALNPADTKLIIRGKVTSVSGGTARIKVKAVRGIAKGTVIARQVRSLLEKQVGQRSAGVTCPKHVPIPTTPSVTCVLRTTQGPRYSVTVRIDAKSRITAKVATRPR
ncbi:hypothetical protein AB0L40_10025 [Patulibacter sp. NPDC049589]|uniref:hypothetical protein n=1 Tax=Patulibacter sp. NPDC049589 TaxID=3154731 RepID=UPI003432FA10